jgi:hypothetical protein
MNVQVPKYDHSDKEITIYAGNTGAIFIDYDDVDHEEAEKIKDIIISALLNAK